jgi:hypothetical protein
MSYIAGTATRHTVTHALQERPQRRQKTVNIMAARGPKSDKIWSDAVRRAVLRRLENEEGKPQKIERLADKVVDMALDGDMSAVNEVANRLDGRPKVSADIEHSGGIVINLVDNFGDQDTK